MTTIPLAHNRFTADQQDWLEENIGPRLFFLHNSIGGRGWVAKRTWLTGMVHESWVITFEDDMMATYFALTFP